MDFNSKVKSHQEHINKYLDSIIPVEHKYIKTILDSMRYSVFAGGKRLRPILMIGVGELYEYPEYNMLPFACSIEMIHTYSLIHDDLPAMDNDDYRRGKLTNHKVYGEGMAVLAGDALLNFAFENMLEFASSKKEFKYVDAALEIARASGIHGMIGGQVVDVENENKVIDKDLMDYMHSKKTGALITASVRAGAIISDASIEDMAILTIYAQKLGLAFQIIDDILDIVGDEKKLGKKTGSDIKKNKATYVSMVGLEKSREMAKQLSYEALEQTKHFNMKGEFLTQLTQYLLNRDF